MFLLNPTLDIFFGPLELATITASGKLRRGGRTTRRENIQEQPLAAE